MKHDFHRYTAKVSKLIGEYFLDLRNRLLNQENMGKISQNKKIHLAKENSLVLEIRKSILI